MRNVKVAAHYYGLFLIKLRKVFPEFVLPIHAEFKPRKLPLGIGRIAVDKIKFVKFKRYHPALVREAEVFHVRQVIAYGEGLLLSEYRRAAVSFFLRAVPILFVAVKLKLYLVRLKLGLLQRNNIRVHGMEKLHEAFAHAGAQPVHVP